MKEKSWEKITVLLKLHVLFIILAFAVGEDRCIPTFQPHTYQLEQQDIRICARVFQREMSWDGASAVCRIHFSSVSNRIYPDTTLHSDLLNGSSTDLLWMGIRRKAHFFLTDTELFEEEENQWGYRWSTGEPRSNDCVALNLTSGSLLTRSCRDELPFVCQTSTSAIDVYEETHSRLACPENWVLSLPLATTGRKCVSSVIDDRSQAEAEEFCASDFGRLATIEEYDILHSRNYLAASSEDTAYWVNRKGYESACPFKVIPAVNGSVSSKRPRNCSKPLQFICVKDFELQNVDVSIGGNPAEAFAVASFCKEDLLTCDFRLNEEDSLAGMASYRWYRNELPLSCTLNACNVHFMKNFLKWWRYGSTNGSLQGSYHCEISFPGLTKTYSSRKMDIFYKDIATYVVDIDGIDLNSFVDYSHHNFERSMEGLNRTVYELLAKQGDRHSSTTWDVQSIRVIRRAVTMKILLYIQRDGTEDDVVLYDQIKKVFEENASVFTYKGKITVRVKSADVCFAEKTDSRKACNNEPVWPTTRETKNALPATECLDEYRKPVYRECKKSLVNKAEWSSFSCSSCKTFRQRFQDSPFQCPDGYSKFRGENICFKIFKEKKNWLDAYETCARISSYMLNEPYSDIGLDSMWLSHRNSYGKIQDFGMKPVNIQLDNVIVENHEAHCVFAVLDGDEFKMKLDNCSKKFPFVCVQNPYELVSSVRYVHTWIKSHLHSQKTCYYFDDIADSWTESGNMCKQTSYGADLLHAMQDIDTYMHFKRIMYKKFNAGCVSETWWMNISHEKGIVRDIDYVDWSPYTNFDLEESLGTVTLYSNNKLHWTLAQKNSSAKLACELKKCEDNRPTEAYIEDRSESPANISHEESLKLIKYFKLKCVPSGWFVTDSMLWYKDGVFLDVLPIHPKWSKNYPSGWLSLAMDWYDKFIFDASTHEFPIPYRNDENSLKKQGYYSCCVDKLEPLQRVCSSNYLIRIPGFHTFVLSMASRNKVYVAECSKYMFQQPFHQQYENVTLKQCFDSYFQDTLIGFHFLLKNLTCNRTHVNILVHVHSKTELRDEEEILNVIQNTDFTKFLETCSFEPSISVRSTVACYGETKKLMNSAVTWPTTPVGKTAFPEELCLTDKGTLLERKCLGDFNSGAVWADVSVDQCSDKQSDKTKDLFQLQREVASSSLKSLRNLTRLTSSPQKLEPADVQIIVQTFGKLADQESLSSEKLNIVVETINNVIDIPPDVLNEAGNSSNQIIGYFEDIASKIDIEDERVNVATENFLVDIYPMSSTAPDSIPNGLIVFNGLSESLVNALPEDLQNRNDGLDVGIVLPSGLIAEKSNSSDRVIYAVYKDFNHVENIKALSQVIHVHFPNAPPSYDLGNDEITMFFKLSEKVDPSSNVTPKCVFWDHHLDKWAYKGCFPKEINETSVLCVCNHLTSFSVIMEIDSTPLSALHINVLDYITYIGCSLSCIGYFLIIMTFLCFREWRNSVKNKSLFNYSISQFIFLLAFMLGINQTSSEDLCKVSAILLHYFLLSSFAWMVVLAYTVYLSLVKVLDTYIPCLIQKFMAFAWGVPAVILIITLSINHKYYARADYCWLSKDVIIYAVVIPLGMMLAVNFSIFGSIFHVNICRRSYLRINQDHRKLVIARAKALFCTSILLGLSWIFGFFAVKEVKLPFEYLFSITTPLQGFLLAIFFVLRPKSTRNLWMRVFFQSDSHKSSTSHTMNSTIFPHSARRSRCENMLHSVVYKAHSPYIPYT